MDQRKELFITVLERDYYLAVNNESIELLGSLMGFQINIHLGF